MILFPCADYQCTSALGSLFTVSICLKKSKEANLEHVITAKAYLSSGLFSTIDIVEESLAHAHGRHRYRANTVPMATVMMEKMMP